MVSSAVSVDFNRIGPGQCTFCGRDKPEVFAVAFADKSFIGNFCGKDLMKAIKMKLVATQPAGDGASAPRSVPPVGNAVK